MSTTESTPLAGVIHLRPQKVNEDNIPFMLIELAHRIERKEIPNPKTIFVVALFEDGDEPLLEHYGKIGNRMEEVGALTIAANWHMRPTGDEEDDG